METSEILNIENHVWNSIKNENDIGLLSGLSGIALFYSNLFEVYKDEKYATRLLKVVERIDWLISEKIPLTTFCSGLAGYGWMLLNLKKNTIAIGDSYFETLDTVLEDALLSFSNKNDYDFLHGATGIAMYFIEQLKVNPNNENTIKVLTLFSKDLLHKLIHDFNNVIISKAEDPKKEIIYFGLAHGISSLINFLCYLNQYITSLKQDIEQALIKLITFLRSKKSFNAISQQYFPSYIDNKDDVGISRLGWCQGDLGIGLALLNASTLLNDNTIKQEAIKLITSTENISLEVSGVLDFSLCHGSVGLVIQYNIAQNKYTLNTEETQKGWYQELQKQTCNFTTFKACRASDLIDHSNIIVGASGLGLTLLTLDGKIKNDWLRCLNLY